MASNIQRDELHKTIWGIADELRGSVDGFERIRKDSSGLCFAYKDIVAGDVAESMLLKMRVQIESIYNII